VKLRKEHRLRVLKNRVLGPKRDEIIGGWKEIHNEDLHKLHSSPNVIIMIKLRRMACITRG
jgi:hypothetical protein